MKSLIITLTGNYNYGNRLQNYALQQVMKLNGVEVETFNNIHINQETIRIKKQIAPKNLRRLIRGIKERIIPKKETNLESKKAREKQIKAFTDKYIKMSNKTKNELMDSYDYAILGSDQIWNPNFVNDFDINLGNCFAGKKVISYAASFGVEKIEAPPIYKLYRDALNNMKAISVRENSGKKIVKELINKEAQVVLDPTMLIEAEKWRKMEKKPKKIGTEKFLLVYCVSKINQGKKKRKIKKIAQRNKLNIIDLTDETKNEYINGVEEFLYYIDNAEMIITDSFHACVFSILFKKNFWIIERNKHQKGMNDRIYTLLETLKIQDRKLQKDTILENCDYSNVDKILEEKRKESMTFLKNALEI